jgi:hypothetical protein
MIKLHPELWSETLDACVALDEIFQHPEHYQHQLQSLDEGFYDGGELVILRGEEEVLREECIALPEVIMGLVVSRGQLREGQPFASLADDETAFYIHVQGDAVHFSVNSHELYTGDAEANPNWAFHRSPVDPARATKIARRYQEIEIGSGEWEVAVCDLGKRFGRFLEIAISQLQRSEAQQCDDHSKLEARLRDWKAILEASVAV